jgi:hypothetical protein
MEPVEDSAERILRTLDGLTGTLNDNHLIVMKTQNRRMWTLGVALLAVNVATVAIVKLVI